MLSRQLSNIHEVIVVPCEFQLAAVEQMHSQLVD